MPSGILPKAPLGGQLPLGSGLRGIEGGRVSRRKVGGRAIGAPSRAGLAFALGTLVMLAATAALAKPAKRQSTYGRTASGNTATTVANQWTSTTKAGSLLIAAITYTGGTGTTVTPPGGAGWTLINAGASN